jgi:hypothetical protein
MEVKMESELEFIRASDIEIRARQRDWNYWKLRGTVLSYPAYPNSSSYGIDLTRFVSSAKVLDIIMQVSGKTWATDKCIAGLVHAIDDILYPQSNLCSAGSDKRMTPEKIKALCQQIRRP